jgi:hypothetical protein
VFQRFQLFDNSAALAGQRRTAGGDGSEHRVAVGFQSETPMELIPEIIEMGLTLNPARRAYRPPEIEAWPPVLSPNLLRDGEANKV